MSAWLEDPLLLVVLQTVRHSVERRIDHFTHLQMTIFSLFATLSVISPYEPIGSGLLLPSSIDAHRVFLFLVPRDSP